MAKYLLSSGTSTTDIVKYVKDLILLNIRVPENSIPMYEFGSPQFITSVLESEVETSIRDVLGKVVNQINNNHQEVKLSLTSVAIKNNIATVLMTINNQVAKYNISI